MQTKLACFVVALLVLGIGVMSGQENKILQFPEFTTEPRWARAQDQKQDVVYLKNGSIIRGYIIEQIPNQTIKIKTSDGSVFVYSMNDVEKITKEDRSAGAATAAPKPLGSGAYSVNPLGFLQLGPVLQAEFKAAPSLLVGPYVRLLGLGLVTHALASYDKLDAGSLAIGGTFRYFFGDPDLHDHFYAGAIAEYGFGGGTISEDSYVNGRYVDGIYKFAYMGFGTNFGYRWRFDSPLFIGLGIMAGASSETSDYRESPQRTDYPKKTYFIGMVEFTIGFETK